MVDCLRHYKHNQKEKFFKDPGFILEILNAVNSYDISDTLVEKRSWKHITHIICRVGEILSTALVGIALVGVAYCLHHYKYNQKVKDPRFILELIDAANCYDVNEILEHMDAELKNNSEVMFAAATKKISSLGEASFALKNDPVFIANIINHNDNKNGNLDMRPIFRSLGRTLKNNKAFILMLLKEIKDTKQKNALVEFISPEFQKDSDIVNAAK
jgi:hypothetical protein